MKEIWHGFECEEFEFEGCDATVVFPKVEPVGKIAIKVEYWNAFPDVEIKLLERGFFVVGVDNISRFATKEDCDIKARFLKYIEEKFSVTGKCVPVGMSCGGAHALRFAGFYPELVSCVFVDAPVINYNSYPGKIGDAECERVWENEFVKAYPGIKRYQLVNFTEHPINMADVLVKNRIPVIMVYGAEDKTVIYEENGRLLEDAFEGTDLLKTIRVGCRGHHPHGMIDTEDNAIIADWINEHS
ncbi:MAG: hypothetical protein IJN78_03215 [Clostridia bacterium]|nr:hypothetical protein [Clostridia bacterium]